ncbi:MAG: ABC transporter ATP-binding protein, partial [Bacteroidota bacterium]
HVLKDINLEIYKGEFVSMIGKSGSGKSTLLYCISTMDTDFNGELRMNGETITSKTQKELAALRNRSIGFVFQFHYLLPEFTCLKNVMLPALRLGKWSYDDIEVKAYQKLEQLGLADQALKPTVKLSGGQQQRVAIARAIINEPDLILCDEPTGNLDSRNTDMVFEVFQEIVASTGSTILTVTHDLDFAQKCDRTIELGDGMILN